MAVSTGPEQRRDATEAELATTRSVALFYLSAWKNSASAKRFAEIYASELGQKYSGLKRNNALSTGSTEIYVTSEGPVTITTRGRNIFVTESIPLDEAAKLATLMLDAQGTGELKQAQFNAPSRQLEKKSGAPVPRFWGPGIQKSPATPSPAASSVSSPTAAS